MKGGETMAHLRSLARAAFGKGASVYVMKDARTHEWCATSGGGRALYAVRPESRGENSRQAVMRRLRHGLELLAKGAMH
jgi:hypothetical protein